MKKPTDTTPAHLGPKAAAFWRGVQAEYGVSDAPGLALLLVAAEALDRLEQAREILAKEGVLAPDRWGVMRKHPALEMERESRGGFLTALRQLGLEVEAEEKPVMGRPPGILPREFRKHA